MPHSFRDQPRNFVARLSTAEKITEVIDGTSRFAKIKAGSRLARWLIRRALGQGRLALRQVTAHKGCFLPILGAAPLPPSLGREIRTVGQRQAAYSLQVLASEAAVILCAQKFNSELVTWSTKRVEPKLCRPQESVKINRAWRARFRYPKVAGAQEHFLAHRA